jgi:hypothetical protein
MIFLGYRWIFLNLYGVGLVFWVNLENVYFGIFWSLRLWGVEIEKFGVRR